MVDENESQKWGDLSPIDGRYGDKLNELRPYMGQWALHKYRTTIEIEYLRLLSDIEDFDYELSSGEKETLNKLEENFSPEDGKLIRQIETDGWEEKNIKATHHDVKAVEYYLREKMKEEHPQFDSSKIHFALTSEDATNIAYSLMIKQGMNEVVLPAMEELGGQVLEMADEYSDLPMLAYTHGQPASPTTLGKEFAVYLDRLGDQYERVKENYKDITGKIGGATGSLNAHKAASEDIDWRKELKEFVRSFELQNTSPTIQINPRDHLAGLFDSIKRFNNILKDMSTDSWIYFHDEVLGEEKGDVGSSTMPHKINPIEFENAEGNLTIANTMFKEIADYITKTRLQRDLSDSTVKRNMSVPMAHSLTAYKYLSRGLNKATPKFEEIEKKLDEMPVILSEAAQTMGRLEGNERAYEVIKGLTQGKEVSLEDTKIWVEELDLSEEKAEELIGMEPSDYTGYSKEMALETVEEHWNTFNH